MKQNVVSTNQYYSFTFSVYHQQRTTAISVKGTAPSPSTLTSTGRIMLPYKLFYIPGRWNAEMEDGSQVPAVYLTVSLVSQCSIWTRRRTWSSRTSNKWLLQAADVTDVGDATTRSSSIMVSSAAYSAVPRDEMMRWLKTYVNVTKDLPMGSKERKTKLYCQKIVMTWQGTGIDEVTLLCTDIADVGRTRGVLVKCNLYNYVNDQIVYSLCKEILDRLLGWCHKCHIVRRCTNGTIFTR